VFDENNIVSCAGLVPVMTLTQQTRFARADHAEGHSRGVEGCLRRREPGTEAGHVDRRDVCRSGQHRRREHPAFGRHEAPLRQPLRTVDGWNVNARVDLLGTIDNSNRCCVTTLFNSQIVSRFCPDSPSARSSTSTLCCVRSMGTANKAPPTGTRKSPGNSFSAKASHRSRPPSLPPDPPRFSRECNTRGQGWVGERCRPDGHPGHQHRPHGAGASGKILVRGDSAYGNSSVIGACRRKGVEFSVVMVKNTAVQHAIDTISDDAWTPVHYPGAVRDPDNGGWISDAEVAETTYTAFSSTNKPVTARLIVRRVKDARYRDALFPVWRYHPFFTNTTQPTTTSVPGCPPNSRRRTGNRSLPCGWRGRWPAPGTGRTTSPEPSTSPPRWPTDSSPSPTRNHHTEPGAPTRRCWST